MDIKTAYGAIENLPAQPNAPSRTDGSIQSKNLKNTSPPHSPHQDLIALSTQSNGAQTQARLITQATQSTENGIRIVENFQTADNRNFSRITNISQTPNGINRDVIQQNPSGSFTRLEDEFSRQDNGLFERSLRFTDETGAIQTRTESDRPPFDPLNLLNQKLSSTQPLRSNGTELRGSQLDIQI